MIEVRCRTNLDLNEEWPTMLPAVPRVGDKIKSAVRHRGGYQLMLEVVEVVWEPGTMPGEWIPRIELHMGSIYRNYPGEGKYSDGSIGAFYIFYAQAVGKSVAAFI